MRTTILLISFTVISFLLFSAYTFSRDDSVLSVDYGKSTFSPDIIPQWKIQMEVGGTSWYDEYSKSFYTGTVYEYKFTQFHLLMELPVLAFRIGLVNNLEIRIAGVFKQEFYRVESNSLLIYNRSNGYYSGAPIEAGLKYKFFNETKYLPKAAASVNLFIPAGNYYFHMDYVSPFFKLMLEKNISKNLGIGINTGYGWNVYDSFKDKYGTASISLNTHLSRKLTAFAEASGIFQNKRLPDHRLGAGLTYRFAKNVMAVVQGGFGLSDRSPDIFGSAGIGLMFP